MKIHTGKEKKMLFTVTQSCISHNLMGHSFSSVMILTPIVHARQLQINFKSFTIFEVQTIIQTVYSSAHFPSCMELRSLYLWLLWLTHRTQKDMASDQNTFWMFSLPNPIRTGFDRVLSLPQLWDRRTPHQRRKVCREIVSVQNCTFETQKSWRIFQTAQFLCCIWLLPQ